MPRRCRYGERHKQAVPAVPAMGEKIMKKISMLLALVACAFAQLVFANSAIVTSITGTVTATTGGAAARTLRQGDEVMQGATVSTAVNSTAVLRFADGQVAALSP